MLQALDQVKPQVKVPGAEGAGNSIVIRMKPDKVLQQH